MTTGVVSRRALRHAAVIGAFGLAVFVWLSPVWASPNDVLPGLGAGDNVSFVWNLWWSRHALAQGTSPLWCPAIFVPFGASLLLHTHTFLACVVAAPFVDTRSLVVGTNAIVAVHLLLNFVTAYGLAVRLTRSIAASAIAAFVFGWSPYVGAHLLGHFNLIAAWILPLTALLALDTLDRSRPDAGLLLGLTLGLAPYLDYYCAAFALVLVGLLAAARTTTIALGPGRRTSAQRTALKLILLLGAAAVMLAVALAVIGGGTIRIASTTLSFRSPHNSISLAGLLFLLAGVIAALPRLDAKIDRAELSLCAIRLVRPALLAGLAVSPLVLAAIHLWWRGDYASQHYLWRSAPAGIDAGTFALGNPRGWLWSGAPLRVFTRLGIDAIEQVAWIAPGVVLLALAALREWRSREGVRYWTLVGAVFLLWALGPYLVAFGRPSPLLLPATLVRFVPIVANARIPARAMIGVYLAVSMLAAYGFVALRVYGRAGLAFVLAGLALADLAPAPTPIYRVDRPTVYDVLRGRREQGAVCELPLGLRDGFGEAGRFDDRVLWYQTIHERGLVGGFVARLPKRMVPAYEAAPVLGSFLRLSAGRPLGDERLIAPAQAADALTAQGVRFIVLNRRTSPADLVTYVRRLGLRSIAQDDEREILIVERAGS